MRGAAGLSATGLFKAIRARRARRRREDAARQALLARIETQMAMARSCAPDGAA
jgi:hypothetical protein